MPTGIDPAYTESCLASLGWAGQTPFAPTQAACLESGLYDSDLALDQAIPQPTVGCIRVAMHRYFCFYGNDLPHHKHHPKPGTLAQVHSPGFMPNYRRLYRPGGSYFFTHVTYQRYPWLCTDLGRQALRDAIIAVRQKYPFAIDAFVLLPDHLHCIWTLPEGDCNYAKRWRLIKLMVTKSCGQELALPSEKTASGERRREGNLWQRRYWEHCIRDEQDFVSHCEYVHYNPVKHGLVECPTDWAFSSVHRYLRE